MLAMRRWADGDSSPILFLSQLEVRGFLVLLKESLPHGELLQQELNMKWLFFLSINNSIICKRNLVMHSIIKEVRASRAQDFLGDWLRCYHLYMMTVLRNKCLYWQWNSAKSENICICKLISFLNLCDLKQLADFFFFNKLYILMQWMLGFLFFSLCLPS